MIVCTETVLIGRKCDSMEEKVKQQYDRWLSQSGMPADLADELNRIAGDEDAITDRFYRELEFGTGGLRGVIGAGTNRMNVYNIRKATQGLANYLNDSDLPKKVAIGYDSRIKSDVFAKETAAVLAANGIKAYIYPRLEPTPALSWAVRYYGCGAGVCVTASHNPAKYNGYKVYGADGCQITLEVAAKILSAIEAVDCFAVQPADFDAALAEGKIEYSSEKCLDDFVDAVYAQRVGDGAGTADLKLVYTPLNGSGLECVKKLLAKLGVTHVTVVPEQEKPDGNFPTCPYPNPEIREAMQKGLELCALNCSGNPLAYEKDMDVTKKTFELAHQLGVKKIVMMSGLPVGCEGDKTPVWITTSWPPETQDILDYQWNQVAIPAWKKLVKLAEDCGIERIALENHGMQLVYNPETLLRLREAVGPMIGMNLDPPHLFWMGGDPIEAARVLGERDALYHVHGKDSRPERRMAGPNGLLDTKPNDQFRTSSRNYVAVGCGHGPQGWKEFFSTVRMAGYDGDISLEMEDLTMPMLEGHLTSLRVLKEALVL